MPELILDGLLAEQRLMANAHVKYEITYRMPDRPDLLQVLNNEMFDVAPDLPAFFAYLDWWRRNVDGPLRKVLYVWKPIVEPREICRCADGVFRLH